MDNKAGVETDPKAVKKLVNGTKIPLQEIESDMKALEKDWDELKKDLGFHFEVTESTVAVRKNSKKGERTIKKMHKATYTFGSNKSDKRVEVTYDGTNNQTSIVCKGKIDADMLKKVKADFKKTNPNAFL